MDKSTILSTSKRLLKMDQLCDMLGLTQWSVYRMIHRREIPFVQIGVRTYRFDPDAIDQWIKGRAIGTVHDIQ